LQKHAVTGSVQDKKKTGTAKLHTTQHADFVNGKIEENPDLSARKLRDLILEEFGINVSVSAVRVYRRKLGWVTSRTRYCQMIRHANKEKRKQWCEEQLERNEQFDVSMSSIHACPYTFGINVILALAILSLFIEHKQSERKRLFHSEQNYYYI
jgi:transposase